MKFKVKLECTYSVSKKHAKEWWGTVDPQEVAKQDAVDIRECMVGGKLFKNVKFSLEPIGHT